MRRPITILPEVATHVVTLDPPWRILLPLIIYCRGTGQLSIRCCQARRLSGGNEIVLWEMAVLVGMRVEQVQPSFLQEITL